MSTPVDYIETTSGLAKHCTKCGELKVLSLFVRDRRATHGRGQPCSDCKVKADTARRKLSLTPKIEPVALKKKGKKKIVKQTPAQRKEHLRKAGTRGGAASAAKKDAKNVLKPPTLSERSSLLFAKASKALKESWFEVDHARYVQEIATLRGQLPGRTASDYQHTLFHAYAGGVIARYGG